MPSDNDSRDNTGKTKHEPSRNRAVFSKEEDEKLKKIVNYARKKKDINWKYVAQQMGTRSVRQCKERWMNYLDKRKNKNEFSKDECAFILEKTNEIGHKWSKIASMMKNRTSISVKLQFYKLMRKRSNMNTEEDTEHYEHTYPNVNTNEEMKNSSNNLNETEENMIEKIIGSLDFNDPDSLGLLL